MLIKLKQTLSLFIGKTGFEPATPWSQTRCSTKLSYFPNNAPSRSRTCNLLIRSQTLYPIALWVHINAEDRDRTGTVITDRRILSPVRLPIPPPRHEMNWQSGRRDSNPRPPPWQGDVLPLNYFRKMPTRGFEPPTPCLQDRCSAN